jgi:plasmid stability protein
MSVHRQDVLPAIVFVDAVMPTITVRNVPEAVHRHLKRRAEEHRRSLNQEVLWVLEEAVAESSESDRQAVRRACREEQERTPSWAIATPEMKRMMREGLA